MNLAPTQKQMDFLNWEFGVFFHFGIRSFFMGHKDFDGIEMPASAFNPDQLDCRKWIRTIKEAGARYAILTCKHHDGFAVWPSRYTEYSVANTPWKDGKGDVVKEFTDACREYGIKVGLYYSPAQWGNTAVSFTEDKAYDDYFINQISELLTGYGKIDYLWFDGNGSAGHKYDQPRIIREIRSLQPDILIFNMWDPDTRWVRDEAGYAPMSMKYVYAFDSDGREIRSRFAPPECDCMMRETWFDCEPNEDTIKPLDILMGIYEYSVGRGCNLLLNIGPDCHGQLPAKDAQRLAEFGDEIRRRYGKALECFGTLQNGNPQTLPENAIPERDYTDTYYIESDKAVPVNCVILEEDLSDGQHIEEFEISALSDHSDKAREISLFIGKTVGRKRICSFPAFLAKKIIVRIRKTDGPYSLQTMKAYHY